MKLRGMFRNKVVQNAGWLIGGRIVNKILAFFVSILTARFLGPGNYGLINYAAAYTTFFASLCTLGINSVIVKNFVDYPEETGETIGTTLGLRAISSVLSAVMIIGIVSLIDHNEPVTIAVVALCTIGMVFQIFDTFNYWFQAKLESRYSAIASVIAYAAYSGYNILLLILGKGVEWFALGTAFEYIISGIVLAVAYFLNGGPRLSFSKRKGKQLLTSSTPFIISGLMVAVYVSTDKLMLKQMEDSSTVGYYSLASSLSVAWAFILSAIIDSLYPGIAESYRVDKTLYQRRNKQLYTIIFYMSFFMSALISIFASPLIHILYGSAYEAAVVPLRITVWYTAFSYLGVARNAWVVCENQQKYLKYLYMGAAGMNVFLNWLFIPVWGASGAASASLATEAATITILPAMIKSMRPNVRLMMDAVLLKDVFPVQKDAPRK